MIATNDDNTTTTKAQPAFQDMEKITPDGGILKLTIRPGDLSAPPPEWSRGSNAKFHYTVHTYSRPGEAAEKGHVHTKSCSHGHSDHAVDGHNHTHIHTHTHDHSETHNSRGEEQRPIRKKVGDSRDLDPEKPFELRIGFNFSVRAMEMCVKTMRVGEKARFLCMPQYCE
ncbi:hypothetical protein HK104_003198, partial [Borealophlyctis nickersoniae]